MSIYDLIFHQTYQNIKGQTYEKYFVGNYISLFCRKVKSLHQVKGNKRSVDQTFHYNKTISYIEFYNKECVHEVVLHIGMLVMFNNNRKYLLKSFRHMIMTDVSM